MEAALAPPDRMKMDLGIPSCKHRHTRHIEERAQERFARAPSPPSSPQRTEKTSDWYLVVEHIPGRQTCQRLVARCRDKPTRGGATAPQDREDGERSTPELSSDAESTPSHAGRKRPLTPQAVPDPHVAEKIAALSRKLGEGHASVPGPHGLASGAQEGWNGRYKPAGYGGLSDGAVGSPSFER